MNSVESNKLYVLVRQDLSVNYQIPQSIHAKDKFTHDYPELEEKWYNSSNTIVVLGVQNVHELQYYALLAQENNLKYSVFFEPDINQNTALAIEPGETTTKLLSQLKLAGQGYKQIVA